MVQLADAEIRTREVLGYRGVHLFHYGMSSCSQKLRIYLNLKKISWQPHLIDLSVSENHAPWYLGVNPRGMVPALVLDGAVHIESNDIIALLEDRFGGIRLIPGGQGVQMARMLRHENALHLDLRTLSFRFLYNRMGSPKSLEILDAFRAAPGIAGGKDDPEKQMEIDFYDRLARDGITNLAIRTAAANFRRAFDELEQRLTAGRYLLGDGLSVLDIAWYIYAKRLTIAGYPLESLHPRLHVWFGGLDARPEFIREVVIPQPLRDVIAANRRAQETSGTTLCAITGLT
jgi:glutathione S-transferase